MKLLRKNMKKKNMLFLVLIFTFQIFTSNCNNLTSEKLNTCCIPLLQRKITRYYNTDKTLSLFELYPKLQKKLPYIPLGNFPTPIIKLKNIEKQIGAKNLYLKNDALSGKPFGGNKVRKLEFLLADAIENGSKSIISIGTAGSNCVLATIIYAKKLGLRTFSMLTPQINTLSLQRNLLLSYFFEGEIHYSETDEERLKNIVEIRKKEKKENKVFPYFITWGGSSPLSTTGFVNAAFELKKQIDQDLLPEPDYLYVTLASAGTAAGLILGLKLVGIKSKVIPVRVCGSIESRTELLISLFTQTNTFLNSLDPLIPLISFPEQDVEIRHDFIGEGYAHITPPATDAIKLLWKTENIKLDGTYTGKTFAALLDDIQNKNIKNKVILFWNTFCSGSFEEIIKNIDYKKLPENLHFYFEQDVQDLDQGV